MARRIPRLLVPVAIALVAMVLAFWAVSPSQAQENAPADPPATTPAGPRDLLDLRVTKFPFPPTQHTPHGPRDCGSCANDDPV